MVGMVGLEPTRPKALVPKTRASTNFATSPYLFIYLYYTRKFDAVPFIFDFFYNECLFVRDN